MSITKIILSGVVLFWAESLMCLEDCRNVTNWKSLFSANGELETAWDADRQAVRFISSFKDGSKSNWLYPGICLSEEDKNADYLEFEVCMEVNPEGRGIKNCLVLFQNASWKTVGSLQYSIPGKGFNTYRMDLRKLRFNLKEAWLIRIGMNFKDASEAALWLRNIQFIKTSAAK